MSVTEEFWRGEFGDAYTERNKVDWTKRIDFFAQIAVATRGEVESVLEVGCNIGSNLKALREIAPGLRLTGVDINRAAVHQARGDGLTVYEASADLHPEMWKAHSDLTMTVGVLIHIPPADIERVMRNIALAARKYVLAIEYASDSEEEIVYRGHAGRLWKRPFGKMYEDLGLKMVTQSDAGEGFDRCSAVLLRK